MVAAGLDRDEALDLREQAGGHWRHGGILGQGIELAAVSHDSGDLGHGLERARLQLRRTAGHKDPGAWTMPVRAANRLARLAHGLVGNGAAVDDDPILAAGRQPRDGLALREIEPAAERDRFGAHRSASRLSSPSKTCVAPPRIRTGCPGSHEIVRKPPGMVTFTGEAVRLLRMAATAVAQAPVPQASVSPEPRSQVFSRIPSASISATLTLIRSGKTASFSMLGPMSSIGTASSSSTKKTTCGLPTLSACGCSRPSQAIGSALVSIGYASGTSFHPNRGSGRATSTSAPSVSPSIKPPSLSML